jgi:hypothetical protein
MSAYAFKTWATVVAPLTFQTCRHRMSYVPDGRDDHGQHQPLDYSNWKLGILDLHAMRA